MNSLVRRIFVEKKPGFGGEAELLLKDLRENLKEERLQGLRLLNCYDVQGLEDDEFEQAVRTVFSEPNTDNVFYETLNKEPEETEIAWAYLPGQYDQRADSAAQCIQLFTQKEMPIVRSSRVVVLKGFNELERICQYLVNPVDSGIIDLEKPKTLEMDAVEPPNVPLVTGFIEKNTQEIRGLKEQLGMAMSYQDLLFCQEYFKSENRDPSFTELRVIDTYWSDHCRHTTFMTCLEDVSFEPGGSVEPIRAAWEEYMALRKNVYGDTERPVTLMDMATVAMKGLRKNGQLKDLEISEEINACSIEVPVDVDGEIQTWLIMFKNETHNHPTEIEPFGGAATCLGGAIRDPLSGRSYVYQAMRVTGSADPRVPVEETLPGKLPQRIITTGAAHGYSSYGNQIGLATGQVREYYHGGFMAKRMEIGAVIGAAPKDQVKRLNPEKGDIIVLVGGRTGRDGCGGATGSSVEHDEASLATCGAQVQKGNAPTERKLQRLFRNPSVSAVIKRSNDFGAGGVSVAIGELADSIDVNLDNVPLKYNGLDGTELAISESQERMAVVIAPEDLPIFMAGVSEENLEAAVVASVTDTGRLRMHWRGDMILDISREFLNTSGVPQVSSAVIAAPEIGKSPFKSHQEYEGPWKTEWLNTLSRLNVASQKGLTERFDSTIGSRSVLMPLGGRYQKSPVDGMVAKVPVGNHETHTATIMTHGYDPELAQWSPFHGAMYALLLAAAKTAAIGGDISRMRYTLQEYFEKLGESPEKWGKPVSALLGALKVQNALGTAAIGGKDSMSGTFKDMNVPPTLVAFAVTPVDEREVTSSEFKGAHNDVLMLRLPRDTFEMPDFDIFKEFAVRIRRWRAEGKILSAGAVDIGGAAAAISKSSFGNRIGVELNPQLDTTMLFEPSYGSFIVEWNGSSKGEEFGELPVLLMGVTTDKQVVSLGGTELSLMDAENAWELPLEHIFPPKSGGIGAVRSFEYTDGSRLSGGMGISKAKVVIPVFPGTNCEDDMERAFAEAGAETSVQVFRNLTPQAIEESISLLEKTIRSAQIIAIPGGFSAGDEPDGSGKFIAAVFRNPRIRDAVSDLLTQRDGLVIGICNGFQALIKLGLISHGTILDLEPDFPTLTYNTIGRHVSTISHIKVTSNMSPWMSEAAVGSVWSVPISHGEGRFVAQPAFLERMVSNGQVATQYVDLNGNATGDGVWNPNGSLEAVEGLFSPDGRVFGKMGHTERYRDGLYKNIPGQMDMGIFRAGVNYFK